MSETTPSEEIIDTALPGRPINAAEANLVKTTLDHILGHYVGMTGALGAYSGFFDINQDGDTVPVLYIGLHEPQPDGSHSVRPLMMLLTQGTFDMVHLSDNSEPLDEEHSDIVRMLTPEEKEAQRQALIDAEIEALLSGGAVD